MNAYEIITSYRYMRRKTFQTSIADSTDAEIDICLYIHQEFLCVATDKNSNEIEHLESMIILLNIFSVFCDSAKVTNTFVSPRYHQEPNEQSNYFYSHFYFAPFRFRYLEDFSKLVFSTKIFFYRYFNSPIQHLSCIEKLLSPLS